MHIERFTVSNLFDTTDHDLRFPLPREGGTEPSVTILYGPNGIGKTTTLRMLDGFMKLDFNIFRRVPFAESSLAFSGGDSISVHKDRSRPASELLVKFRNHEVRLHPEKPGALDTSGQAGVEAFRKSFFETTEALNFELIDTSRVLGLSSSRDEDLLSGGIVRTETEWQVLSSALRTLNPKAKRREEFRSLAARVQRFARDAQANYRRFFSTTQPDLFPKILERLAEAPAKEVAPAELLTRLRAVQDADKEAARLGLEVEPWDYRTVAGFIEGKRKGARLSRVVAVLETYLEALESRAAERELIASRLRTFERLMGEFYEKKTVVVDARKGFEIRGQNKAVLSEDQLSSGEYHLLYLMVAALVTQKRGSVLAIDEPEMSMHLGWQRKLVRALVECSAGAQPQFVLATHSPDIAAEHREFLVSLGAAAA